MLRADDLLKELSGGFRSTFLESYSYPLLKRIYELKQKGIDVSIFNFVYAKSLITFFEEGYKLSDYAYFNNTLNIQNVAIEELMKLHKLGYELDMFQVEGVTYTPRVLKKLSTLQQNGINLWKNYDYTKYTEQQLINLIDWDTCEKDFSCIPREYLKDISFQYLNTVVQFIKESNDFQFLVRNYKNRDLVTYLKLCKLNNLDIIRLEKILKTSETREQLETNMGVLLTSRKLKQSYINYEDYIVSTYGDLKETVKDKVHSIDRYIRSELINILTECVGKGLPLASISEHSLSLFRDSRLKYFNLLAFWVSGMDLEIITNLGYSKEEIQDLFNQSEEELDEMENELRKTYVWSYLTNYRRR